MKNCPSPECGNFVPPHQFCCSFHWQRLPFTLKTRLNDLKYHLRREEVPVSEVVRCEADIRRAMNWEEDEPEQSVNRHNCLICGREVFAVYDRQGESAFLEQVKTIQDAAVLLAQERLFYIIGFTCVSAAGLCGSYTPFGPHLCRLAAYTGRVKSPRMMLVGSTQ